MAEFQMDDEEEEEEKEKEEKQWKGEWNRFLCLVNEDYPRQGGGIRIGVPDVCGPLSLCFALKCRVS